VWRTAGTPPTVPLQGAPEGAPQGRLGVRRPGAVVRGSGLCERVLFLADALEAIAVRRLPEQLFSLLQMHQVVEAISPEVRTLSRRNEG